jgi:hypothetical protein
MLNVVKLSDVMLSVAAAKIYTVGEEELNSDGFICQLPLLMLRFNDYEICNKSLTQNDLA